jgi:hypothetical protein
VSGRPLGSYPSSHLGRYRSELRIVIGKKIQAACDPQLAQHRRIHKCRQTSARPGEALLSLAQYELIKRN